MTLENGQGKASTMPPEGEDNFKTDQLHTLQRKFGPAPDIGACTMPVTSIIEDPRNERKVYPNLEGLVASIQEVGLVEPLIVTPSQGKYMILSGHRRFRAARLAGLKRINVVVQEAPTDQLRRRRRLICNIQRESLNPIELAEAFASMLVEDSEIKSQRRLATLVGKDEAWVSGILKILTLPVDLLKKLETSPVSVPYDCAIRIARVADPALQKQLIDKVLAGASTAEIRQSIADAGAKQAKTFKLTARKHGYTVTVTGPNAPGAIESMKGAVAELIKQLNKRGAGPLEFQEAGKDEKET